MPIAIGKQAIVIGAGMGGLAAGCRAAKLKFALAGNALTQFGDDLSKYSRRVPVRWRAGAGSPWLTRAGASSRRRIDEASNIAFDRTAGSHALAAAGQRERSPHRSLAMGG